MEQRFKDEIYIRRCLQLAENGRLGTSPNPMVGAVIVHEDRIIGEGYHICCGHAHAEVNAIRSVGDQSLLKDSTIYVSLEPCSHHGKTPPCADLIIEKQIPRVVVGCRDPSSKVGGKGIKKLRDAGREVVVGVLEEECKALISHFTVANIRHRPYIVLKWAESLDGFLDIHRTDGVPAHLSTDETAMLVHKRRAEIDAIMVGTRTAALDNPGLNVRYWHGRNPLRVVIDRSLKLDTDLQLFDGSTPTLVYTTKAVEATISPVTYVALDPSQSALSQIVSDLHHRHIQTLLVEGGAQLLQSFINDELWDEAWVEISAGTLSDGVESPQIPRRKHVSLQKRFGVNLLHYRNNN